MGATVNAYKRLPEHTTVPDAAWEIDDLIEEISVLSDKLTQRRDKLIYKSIAYHCYLRQHWTQEEILASQEVTS